MKAYLIDPAKQFISRIEVESEEDIKKQIGSQQVESEELDDAGDRLFFSTSSSEQDEKQRFQVDNMIPVTGKGIIVGTIDGDRLCDANLELYYLGRRVHFF